MKKIKLSAVVSCISLFGKRLDKVLSQLFNKYSRSYLKQLILLNQVFVENKIVNHPDKKILGGEVITIYCTAKKMSSYIPENIFLNIIYEDEEILVINKPKGLIVHPGAGNDTGTILNALLYRYQNIKDLPRAGIVHRLDKDTSGLMVIAKTVYSYNFLKNLLKYRKIIREYQAIVKGNIISGGTIDVPIMRHFKKRQCMMVHILGKKSITNYKVVNHLKFYTHIKIRLKTGRTHQIRVHMSYIKHPLLGDPVYGNVYRYVDQKNKKIFEFSRQALHANHIAFIHPIHHNFMSWTIPLPEDIKQLILHLQRI